MKYGTDSEKVIKQFIEFFARFGLADVVVTDNGPPFNSKHFISFMERQGIQVFKSPPYHPQSNGQAERLVRVSKEVLKKIPFGSHIETFRFTRKNPLFSFQLQKHLFI